MERSGAMEDKKDMQSGQARQNRKLFFFIKVQKAKEKVDWRHLEHKAADELEFVDVEVRKAAGEKADSKVLKFSKIVRLSESGNEFQKNIREFIENYNKKYHTSIVLIDGLVSNKLGSCKREIVYCEER